MELTITDFLCYLPDPDISTTIPLSTPPKVTGAISGQQPKRMKKLCIISISKLPATTPDWSSGHWTTKRSPFVASRQNPSPPIFPMKILSGMAPRRWKHKRVSSMLLWIQITSRTISVSIQQTPST